MCFQALVDNFDMTISLGVMCGVEIQLSVMELKQLLPKIASEGGVTIHHN